VAGRAEGVSQGIILPDVMQSPLLCQGKSEDRGVKVIISTSWRAETLNQAPPRSRPERRHLACGIAEACELLQVSRTYLMHMIATGQLRARRRGRRWIISEAALREFLGDPAP
jgi:excisionase family DNA binding protein